MFVISQCMKTSYCSMLDQCAQMAYNLRVILTIHWPRIVYRISRDLYTLHGI